MIPDISIRLNYLNMLNIVQVVYFRKLFQSRGQVDEVMPGRHFIPNTAAKSRAVRLLRERECWPEFPYTETREPVAHVYARLQRLPLYYARHKAACERITCTVCIRNLGLGNGMHREFFDGRLAT